MASSGAVASRPLLLEGALDQVVDVALGVADRRDPVGDVDVAHQVGEHLREEVAQVVAGRAAPGASSSAARTCRSGSASKVNRNASGAVSETAMPCGTIGSSAG